MTLSPNFDVDGFVKYLTGVMGYSILEVSNNPYEVARLKNNPKRGEEKRTVVVYRKSTGAVSVADSNRDLLESFKNHTIFNSSNARINSSKVNLINAEVNNILAQLKGCGNELELDSIINSITDISVARELVRRLV